MDYACHFSQLQQILFDLLQYRFYLPFDSDIVHFPSSFDLICWRSRCMTSCLLPSAVLYSSNLLQLIDSPAGLAGLRHLTRLVACRGDPQARSIWGPRRGGSHTHATKWRSVSSVCRVEIEASLPLSAGPPGVAGGDQGAEQAVARAGVHAPGCVAISWVAMRIG
jgi:hypothetical protein